MDKLDEIALSVISAARETADAYASELTAEYTFDTIVDHEIERAADEHSIALCTLGERVTRLLTAQREHAERGAQYAAELAAEHAACEAEWAEMYPAVGTAAWQRLQDAIAAQRAAEISAAKRANRNRRDRERRAARKRSAQIAAEVAAEEAARDAVPSGPFYVVDDVDWDGNVIYLVGCTDASVDTNYGHYESYDECADDVRELNRRHALAQR